MSIVEFASIAIGIFGGIKFYLEYKTSNKWKRVELAQGILKDLFQTSLSRNAFKMLDWSERTYIEEETSHEINEEDVLKALRVKDLMSLTLKEQYIRDCFDSLYDQIDSIEHFIQRGLLDEDDILPPLKYYRSKLMRHRLAHFMFMETYGYSLSLKFWNRFE